MKHYGKTLMHHVPESTTVLLKRLCTNYQPIQDSTDRDSVDKLIVDKVIFVMFQIGTVVAHWVRALS